jgi:hypothetical protein
MVDFRSGLLRCLRWTLGVTMAAGLAVLLVGRPLAHIIFDGNIVVQPVELIVIVMLLFGLGLICISVYLQNGLGRFGALVGPSFLFLVGSLLSVPLALLMPGDLAFAFLALYAAVHLALAVVHGRMLAGLGRERTA